jgi:hypothetical protein
MSFENLVVEKVVLHEVFKRRHDGALVTPRYAAQLVVLPADAMASFTERVVDAMGDASQSMELEIAEHGPDSAVAIASALVSKPDGAFLAGSTKFADKLANAQRDGSARAWRSPSSPDREAYRVAMNEIW